MTQASSATVPAPAACGTPAVSNRASRTGWSLRYAHSQLPGPIVNDLPDAMCSALENPASRQRLPIGGLGTAVRSGQGRAAGRVGAIAHAIDAGKTGG
jgi:hypothetical protein